jgi:kynurenine formamidase
MIVNINIGQRVFKVDLDQPIDLSLVSKTKKSFKAWYSNEITFNTIKEGDFIGSVSEGGPVNFKEIIINPHANMTHTESVGHISKEIVPVNSILQPFHFLAQLITLHPLSVDKEINTQSLGDLCVQLEQIENKIEPNINALIIRTQEHYNDLSEKEYSNTNWPYLSEDTALYIRKMGIRHLLIDQPSVDKEVDGGKLLAHKAFWNYPSTIDTKRTITELIGVPNKVDDGVFLLNLSIANIENDASPSRPVIYRLIQ